MAKTLSIRNHFILNLTLLIFVLAGGIIVTLMMGARQAIQVLTGMVITQTLKQTDEVLESFIQPVRQQLLGIKIWGEAGLVNVGDPKKSAMMLEPLLSDQSKMASIVLADADGRGFVLCRPGMEQQHVNPHHPVTATAEQDTKRRQWHLVTFPDQVSYDPRKQAWFSSAIGRANEPVQTPADINPEQSICWIPSGHLEFAKSIGTMISVAYMTPDRMTHVLGFEIPSSDMISFVESLRPLNQGRVFLLDHDQQLLGFSPDQPKMDMSGRQIKSENNPADQPGMADTIKALGIDPGGGHDYTMPVRFESRGRIWWAAGREHNIAEGRMYWTFVVIPESAVQMSLNQHRTVIVIIMIIVLIFGGIRAVSLAKKLSLPIEQLVRQSDRISRGDLKATPPIQSNITEVSQLTQAQERMRQGLQTLMKLESDLKVARTIQQNTLPMVLPQLKDFELAAWNQPAEQTGGDTYDIIGYRTNPDSRTPEPVINGAEKAILLLADATGHGIGPALSVTQIRAMLRMAVHIIPDISVIAEHMNEQLCSDLPQGRFITAWLGEINVAEQTLSYFSAGQGPLIYYQAAADQFSVYDADTCPFGIIADLDTTAANTIPMAEGDLFAVISDGIFEATNTYKEQFGIDRVKDILRQSKNESSMEIISRLREAVAQFTREMQQDDDQTMILIKRL